MAATDQHYRSQTTLDIIFGVSCVALLLSTGWMLWQDYNKDFKAQQRIFRDVEATIAEREMIDKMPDVATVREKRENLQQVRAQLKSEKDRLKGDSDKLTAEREIADSKYRDIKANYDAQMSYYNIAIDEVGKVPLESPRHKILLAEADRQKAILDKLEKDLVQQKAELDKIDLKIKKEIRSYLEPLEAAVAKAEEEQKQINTLFDRYAKQSAPTAWNWSDEIRSLPVLDGFESPLKIKQIWLPDLTIDYGGFKDVPRYDRCTTCHLGIDRGAFDKDTLRALGDDRESERLSGKVTDAQAMLQRRAAAGENLGFDPGNLPGEPRTNTKWMGLTVLTWLTLLMVACTLVGALSLGILERSVRLGVRVMVAGLVLSLLSSGAIAFFAPRVPAVKSIKLDEGKVTQFCAHPRMDLFVDSNSPHPMEKFGCTICHAGQGSATEFLNATHTPSNANQEKEWRKRYGWEPPHAGEFPPNYHWDFPMLQGRFVESSCLKCHHQVTDLIRYGNKEEAPKLLRGYRLVKEMGCFGCHEIQGIKNNRPVGPDLRLEPSPALDWLSAAEQERVKADTANPPGQLRKVGPSLRRLSEKTGEEWTRKWILNPRGFRDDTRMPHFYGLSTNTEEHLKKEDEANKKTNPEAVEQHKFPSTEIHAIAHYLMYESREGLKGNDSYRRALLRGKRNLHELQDDLAKGSLSDRDMKDLLDLSKRFGDLALLSSPLQASAINSGLASQRQLQERIQDLHKQIAQGGTPEAIKSAKEELVVAITELASATRALEKLATPTPLSTVVIGEDGNPVTVPEKAGNENNGRLLFTEKGCLACHAHEGTTKPDDKNKTPGVSSDAIFGPELSRIADKLLMANSLTKDGNAVSDPLKARRWLVQWLLNPSVYHPRTRMPITHLKPAEANDIATWLLAQKTNWKGEDPSNPDETAIRSLARLHLSRQPGFTREDIDKFIPANPKDNAPGISKERAESLPREADERELAEGKITKDRLLWYIGKRAVGRLGCYGCHDIPGFETAKPIGTGLNDWGKKDHDKLAFEDGEAFAKEHYNIVFTRFTREKAENRILDLWKKGAATMTFGDPEMDKQAKAAFSAWLDGVKDIHKTLAEQPSEVDLKVKYTAALTEATKKIQEEIKKLEDGIKAKQDEKEKEADRQQVKDLKARLDVLGEADRAKRMTPFSELAETPIFNWVILHAAETRLADAEVKELARMKKALDPETQKLILELHEKKLEKGLSASEKKQYEELHPLQFFAPHKNKHPVEEIFFESLAHHHREGFLHQKLMNPRSYDFNRIRLWDDRLRMPQFKFARTRKKVGESDEQFASRAAAEEAEAREAVMTFVLGLVADPIPLKYVSQPKNEKLAEAVGRQVLEKYNCGGCHQIRPGVYEFKHDQVVKMLERSYELPGFKSSMVDDFHFPHSNAWVGPAPTSDQLMAFGYLDAKKTTADQDVPGLEGTAAIRLTDAFRFNGTDKMARNMPAGTYLSLPAGKFRETPGFGGTFVDMMTPYLTTKDKTKYPTPPSHLPPPLLRQGERVQPDWLYKFLLNPGVVRPEGYMVLRMPKFNMSPDESRALVNYFAAVSRMTNPGQGVTWPYVQVEQRDPEYWRHRVKEYEGRLNEAKNGVERLNKQTAKLTKDKEANEAEQKKIEAALKQQKDDKKAEADRKRLEKLKVEAAMLTAEAERLKKLAPFVKQQQEIAEAQLKEKPPAKTTVATDLYSRQAYKLLTNRELCLKCHNIGNVVIEGAQGPNLALAPERLRPEWMEQWIAKPPRLFPYEPVMPQNFPNKTDPLQWVEQKNFVGTPLQQTRAVRDILMDSARLNDLLTHSPPPPPPPVGGPKK